MAARWGSALGGGCLKQPQLRGRGAFSPDPGSLICAAGSHLLPMGLAAWNTFKDKFSSPPLFPLIIKQDPCYPFQCEGHLGTVLFLQQPSGEDRYLWEGEFESLQTKAKIQCSSWPSQPLSRWMKGTVLPLFQIERTGCVCILQHGRHSLRKPRGSK